MIINNIIQQISQLKDKEKTIINLPNEIMYLEVSRHNNHLNFYCKFKTSKLYIEESFLKSEKDIYIQFINDILNNQDILLKLNQKFKNENKKIKVILDVSRIFLIIPLNKRRGK